MGDSFHELIVISAKLQFFYKVTGKISTEKKARIRQTEIITNLRLIGNFLSNVVNLQLPMYHIKNFAMSFIKYS